MVEYTMMSFLSPNERESPNKAEQTTAFLRFFSFLHITHPRLAWVGVDCAAVHPGAAGPSVAARQQLQRLRSCAETREHPASTCCTPCAG